MYNIRGRNLGDNVGDVEHRQHSPVFERDSVGLDEQKVQPQKQNIQILEENSMKTIRSLLSIIFVVVLLFAATTSAYADLASHSWTEHVNGFDVSCGLSVKNIRTGRASLSCDGTSTQNPKPPRIYASLSITVYDNNGQSYNASGSASALYGDPISITKTKSTSSTTTLYRVVGAYTFMGNTWAYQLSNPN